MLFIPKNTKFTKQQKGKKFNKITQSVSLQKIHSPLEIAVLRSLNHARVSEKQLSTIKQFLARKMKKRGKFSIKLFADVPVSKKPLEIRMGKGKGPVDIWISRIAPGLPILEISEMSMLRARRLLRMVQKKLSIRTNIDIL